MSNFDPQTFLSGAQKGGFSTQIPACPEGDYPAMVTKIEAKQQASTKGDGKIFTIVDVTFEIDDARAREVTGMDRPTSRMSVFLDLTDTGELDRSKEKNTQLGKLLEGLGLNGDGQDWQWSDLVNRPCIVHIEHTPNKRDPKAQPFANVSRVGKLG